jgi:HEAT repeat protein
MGRRKRLIAIAVSLAFIVYIAIAVHATRHKWLPWVPGIATKLEPTPDPMVEGRPLEQWVKDLGNSNPDVRRQAAEKLGENGKFFPRAPKVAQALGKLLHDTDADVRTAAVVAVGRVHLWAQAELTALLQIAQDDAFELQAKALEALVPFVDSDERVKEHFRLAIEDQNPAIRSSVFEMLARTARNSSQSLTLLNNALKSKDDDVRLRALTACSRLGSDAKDSLDTFCDMLHERDVALRRKAAEAASWATSTSGFGAGAMINPGEPLDAAELLDDEKREQEGNEGAWLNDMPQGGKIKAALIAALKDPDGEVRRWVAATVSNLGAPLLDAKPVLLGLLKDSDDLVRANAVSAIGNFGPAARDAEAHLLAALKNDKTARVRYRSIAALRKIGSEPKVLLRPLLASLRDLQERVRVDSSHRLGEFLATAGNLSDDEYKEVFFALLGMCKKTIDGLQRDDQSGNDITLQGWTLDNLDQVDSEIAKIILPELVDQLKQSSNDSRYVTTRAFRSLLIRLQYAERVTRHENAFQDSESGRRVRSAVQAAIPELIKDLSSPHYSTKHSAALALAVVGDEARPVIVELGKKLESKDKKEIMEALETLLWFDRQAVDAAPGIIKLFRSTDREIQVEAAMLLRNIGQPARAATPALLDAIRDPKTDAGVAEQAAAALVQIDVSAAHRVYKEDINPGARRYLERVFNPRIPD